MARFLVEPKLMVEPGQCRPGAARVGGIGADLSETGWSWRATAIRIRLPGHEQLVEVLILLDGLKADRRHALLLTQVLVPDRIEVVMEPLPIAP